MHLEVTLDLFDSLAELTWLIRFFFFFFSWRVMHIR